MATPMEQAKVSRMPQKARGLRAIADYRLAGVDILRAKYVNTASELLATLEKGAFPDDLFIRPCPIRPRHGFVDSRPVKREDKDAALAILAETLAADPEGGVLVTPLIDAVANVVLTPSSITLGPGHDGATSGRDTITLPVNFDANQAFGYILTEAGLTSSDSPFFEAVLTGSHRPTVTQLRAGPETPRTADFIPEPVTVQTVVMPANESLLEWETKVATFGPGTVVVHPGGSLTSHFAVHCVLARIPFVTSDRPVKPGITLLPTSLPIGYDRKAFLYGLVAGMLTQTNPHPDIATVLLATHQSPVLTDKHAFWIGVGCSFMLRYGTAAALGEYRHACKKKRQSRDQVYERALAPGIDGYRAHRKRLTGAFRSFCHGKWRSGFGGTAWANCVRALLALDKAVLGAVRGTGAVEEAIAKLNVAVNEAHNGGWWLNKFAPKSLFDNAASGHPWLGLLAASTLWRIHTTRPNGTDTSVTLKKWHRLHSDHATHVEKPKPVKVVAAQAKLNPDGSLHVQYKLAGVASYKSVNVALNPDWRMSFANYAATYACSGFYKSYGSDARDYAPLDVWNTETHGGCTLPNGIPVTLK